MHRLGAQFLSDRDQGLTNISGYHSKRQISM